MTLFQDDAARFATTRETHAQTLAHIDRTIGEIRTSAVQLAVQELIDGHKSAAADVMEDCLIEQLALAKIRVRHLEAVSAR